MKLAYVYDIIFDVETNAIKYDEITNFHLLCVLIVQTKEVFSFRDNDPRFLPVSDGIELINNAENVIGHNIVRYDIPVVRKFHPNLEPKNVIDTMQMCQMFFSLPTLMEIDRPLYADGTLDFTDLHRQSLKVWGKRLGNAKTDYQGGFETFNDAMWHYCEQDCRTNLTVYEMLCELV